MSMDGALLFWIKCNWICGICSLENYAELVLPHQPLQGIFCALSHSLNDLLDVCVTGVTSFVSGTHVAYGGHWHRFPHKQPGYEGEAKTLTAPPPIVPPRPMNAGTCDWTAVRRFEIPPLTSLVCGRSEVLWRRCRGREIRTPEDRRTTILCGDIPSLAPYFDEQRLLMVLGFLISDILVPGE